MQSKATHALFVLASICLLWSSAASADQCAVVSRDEGARAVALLKPSSTIVSYCEPCGEKKPGPIETVHAAVLRPWSEGDGQVEVVIDGEPSDLAYVFLGAGGDRFDNLAKLVGCDTSEVSPSIRKAPVSSTSLGAVVLEIGAVRVTHAIAAQAPAFFVRVRAGSASPVLYDTPIARGSFEHDFASRFVVPLDAVPALGLQLEVVNGDDPSERFGEIELGRDRLVVLAREGPTTFEDGDVEKLVLRVRASRPTSTSQRFELDVHRGFVEVPGVHVDAGQVLEVCATGAYQLRNGFTIPPVGVMGYDDTDQRLVDAKASLGAAMMRLGTSAPTGVAPCTTVFARVGGAVSFGINDRHPSEYHGVLHFLFRVSDATADEWHDQSATRHPITLVSDLPKATLTVDTTPSGASILVDGEPVKQRSVEVLAGPHAVWAFWLDLQKLTSVMQDVSVGEVATVHLTPPADE